MSRPRAWRGLVAGIAVWVLGFSQAQAWGWLQGAPQEETTQDDLARDMPPPPAALSSSVGPDDGICLAAILAAERRYNIPDNLLLALGLQEAGFKSQAGLTVWPWSINAAGEGFRFKSAHSAINFVRQKLASGVASIDVGCMQINLRWHPDAFTDLSHGFDPVRNVDYAARFLLSLREQSPDWWTAAGRYHSWSEGPQRIYLTSLKRNQQVAQNRFATFAQLAKLEPSLHANWPQAEASPPAPPNYRTEGAIWGADISGQEGGNRTLYSADEIQPILPQFIESEI